MLSDLLIGDANAGHRLGDACVDGNMLEHCADLLGGAPITQCAANMQPNLVQLAEYRDDGDGQKAAHPRVKRIVEPGLTPCPPGNEFLERSGEGSGVVHCCVNVVVTQD